MYTQLLKGYYSKFKQTNCTKTREQPNRGFQVLCSDHRGSFQLAQFDLTIKKSNDMKKDISSSKLKKVEWELI